MAHFRLTKAEVATLSRELCTDHLYLLASELSKLTAQAYGASTVNDCVKRCLKTSITTDRKASIRKRALQALAFEDANREMLAYGARLTAMVRAERAADAQHARLYEQSQGRSNEHSTDRSNSDPTLDLGGGA